MFIKNFSGDADHDKKDVEISNRGRITKRTSSVKEMMTPTRGS